MADTARADASFTLDVATGTHAPSTGRLFIAAVLRTFDVDEETVEDAKLAVSEAVTAATVAGHDRVSVAVDAETGVVRIAPLTTQDVAGDAFDVVNALFPGATMEADLQFTIPLDGALT